MGCGFGIVWDSCFVGWVVLSLEDIFFLFLCVVFLFEWIVHH